MGWINKAKAGSARDTAQNAIDAGRSVLVYKVIEANTNSMTTGAMTGVNDQIEEIEALGWHLEHMAAGEGKALSGERLALILLFRRPVS